MALELEEAADQLGVDVLAVTTAESARCIWSSGRILELTVKSMISRQRFNDKEKLITQSDASASEVETYVNETL